MATLNESFPQGTGSGSHPKCQDTTLEVQKLKLVNAGVSKLMLLSINLLLPVLVHAARHSLTTVRHKYALTVDPTIYTLYIKQFWAIAKVITVNGEIQIQALVDGKKVIVTETSVRRALHLKYVEGIYCLPTTTIFAELERMSAKTTAWNKFSSTMASAIILFLDKQVEGMSKHKETYGIPSHIKKIFANIKREGKGFSGRDTPLFFTMMVQAQQEEDEGSAIPTDPHPTPSITQPSSSQPQQKQKP
ncbi:hypothetical protein Tco_1279031, partial [Tanacetum coccineum]